MHRYRPRAAVVFTELDDGSAVLLDLDSKFYFSLNPTGAHIWKHCADAPADRDEIVASLCAEFAVDADRARADVDGLLAKLTTERLIERVEA